MLNQFLSFTPENWITVGIMLALWIVCLHLAGQGLQYLKAQQAAN